MARPEDGWPSGGVTALAAAFDSADPAAIDASLLSSAQPPRAPRQHPAALESAGDAP